MGKTVNPKKLIFFTSAFPYGEGEQFIETEIQFLSKAFEVVHIYPTVKTGKRREVPSNVFVEESHLYTSYNRVALLKKNFFKVVYVFLYELIKSKHRKHYLKKFSIYFNFLLHRFNDAAWLDSIIEKHGQHNTVYYTYWFDLWAQVLSICQYKNRKLPVLARLHGGDYDEAQNKEGFFPFRYFEMAQWRSLHPVSQFGYNYLMKQFPYYEGTMEVSRLGVNDHGENPLNTTGEFVIVSCSFLIPLKRVHLIIEILRHLKLKIKWVHFGAGELEKEMKDHAATLPQNVQYEFKGYVSNAEILSFYANEPVDLFINVSELEGIPVSIMEAISFGIPVIGCRICGVPEIVNSETGFLLELNFDPGKVAETVQNYLASASEKRISLRKSAREYWRREYNAEKNYSEFINKHLIILCAA